MPSVNNTKLKGLNSGTTVQKTLKLEATTYFARCDVGTSGTGSLVQSGGQSKGVLAFAGPDANNSVGQYIFLYAPQEAWLGSPSVSWVSGDMIIMDLIVVNHRVIFMTMNPMRMKIGVIPMI